MTIKHENYNVYSFSIKKTLSSKTVEKFYQKQHKDGDRISNQSSCLEIDNYVKLLVVAHYNVILNIILYM